MRPWPALLLCCFLLLSCREAAQRTPPTSSPTSTTIDSRSPALAVTRLWNLGPVADIAVGPEAVYALYSPGTSEGALANATDTRLARIDRTTGVVLTAGPFPFALRVALAGTVVWIGPNNQYSGTSAPDSRTIVSVDARTLGTQQRVTLPADASQEQLIANVSSDSDSVWVAYGSHLYRLAAGSGRILVSRSVGGVATSVALDPGGQRLYVGIDAAVPNKSEASVTEFEPATLKPLVSATTGGGGLGGPQVAAGADDVWISYATGMLGEVEHRQASNLAALPLAAVPHSNGVRVFEAGGIVWISDMMAGQLMCLDPQTGAVRVRWVVAQGGIVAGNGTAVYFGALFGVASVQPDPRCR